MLEQFVNCQKCYMRAPPIAFLLSFNEFDVFFYVILFTVDCDN